MTTRTTEVTRALLAPGPVTLPEPAWRRVREHLHAGVARALDGQPRGPRIDVTHRTLRRAASDPMSADLPDPPFAWKPALARRSLGLASVRACADGGYRGPADAVGPLAEAALEEWRRTGWRTFFWEPWYAGLGPGGRSVVLAEAVGWATSLWAGLDWGLLGGCAELGGADDLWTCPGPRPVRCRARTEVRVGFGRSGGTGSAGRPATTDGTSLVSLSGGSPGERWQAELAYLAMVRGLGSSTHPAAIRVLGFWPDAGIRRLLDVDEPMLVAAADRVAAAVAAILAAGTELVAAS